jgi:hypothetical protein
MTVNMHRALDRSFPEPDTLTYAEWLHREATFSPPAPPIDVRPCCVVCAAPFTPKHPTQRFCGRPCRVWWHGGVGATERRRAVA